jgi:uncharacterized protein Yka (UPF0111/DUF47 family)
MRRWFLPRDPDVLARLQAQSAVTVDGITAFRAWCNGDAASAQRVRDAEHRADDAKRDLQRELRTAFATPLDAEDIYELSERLDEVLGNAKDLVREAEALAIAPDPPLAEMALHIAEGVGHLADAFAALPDDLDAATGHADAARRASRTLEKVYQSAMSATVNAPDPARQFPRRELYRRASRLADSIIRVAERVWYAVVKQA